MSKTPLLSVKEETAIENSIKERKAVFVDQLHQPIHSNSETEIHSELNGAFNSQNIQFIEDLGDFNYPPLYSAREKIVESMLGY